MAMKGIMKKIISPPRIRSMEVLRRVPRYFSTTNTVMEDRTGYLNNESVVSDLERILKDGKRSLGEQAKDLESLKKSDRDERWENWVHSSHELWKQKNEEEQRRDLDMYWRYLRDYLHRKGVDTSNHRPLLSMKMIQPDDPASKSEGGGRMCEISIASPDKGCISFNRLVLDCNWPVLPRQSVNGLLCFILGNILIYNPVTGEASSSIKINANPMRKHCRIAFGYNPQSNEHKVISITGSDKYAYGWGPKGLSISKRPKDQVVEVFTVGTNTWRRIDATPPISIAYEDPFYVDGCIYWRFRHTDIEHGWLEQIMKFDIVTEKFKVIPIPGFVIDSGRHKWSQTVELTEVDGRIAVLDWQGEECICLWMIHEEADGNISWTEQIIDVSYWNGKEELSIEALTGTNTIFYQAEYDDSIFYYNRNTKESIRFPIAPNWEPFDTRIIQM